MVRRHSFSSNRSQFSSVRIGHSSVQFESVTVATVHQSVTRNTTVAGRAAGLPAPLLAATVRTKKLPGVFMTPVLYAGIT